ncbi:MAG: hypothetical protein ACYDA5_05445 [Vulcanimicrobiaceae bacterium]
MSGPARVSTQLVGALAALAFMSACAAHRPDDVATTGPLLLDSRGVVMPLGKAITKIGFTPTLPHGRMLGVAVIPPLGNLDKRSTRGIAFEYRHAKGALVLSEWPTQRLTISFGRLGNPALHPCTAIRYMPQGYAWATKRRLTMTLQPDGHIAAHALRHEAVNLAKTTCG